MTEPMRTRRRPLKDVSRRLRLALYHWRHGPGFAYHGIPISIPDEIPFSIKRQLMQGRYEEPERRLVERFINPTLPLIEVGGSLGVLSAFIGRKLHPRTPYLVVEANTRIIETCRANARTGRGPDGRVTVMNCALAYGASEVSFPVDDNIHANRLNGTAQETITVPAHTLAALRQMLDPGPDPFTLVMDIEGYEFDVFETDGETLRECKLAIVETHPGLFAERGRSLDGFLALVRDLGFEILAQDGVSYAFGRT